MRTQARTLSSHAPPLVSPSTTFRLDLSMEIQSSTPRPCLTLRRYGRTEHYLLQHRLLGRLSFPVAGSGLLRPALAGLWLALAWTEHSRPGGRRTRADAGFLVTCVCLVVQRADVRYLASSPHEGKAVDTRGFFVVPGSHWPARPRLLFVCLACCRRLGARRESELRLL